MLKSLPLILGLVFLGACSDDSSIDQKETTRDNNGGIIITTDTGTDAAPNDDCGNGVLDEGELCDDENAQDGDYCSADCSEIIGSCGDGIVQENEACDGEDCTADCQSERTSDCGNGVIDDGELCDDGNQTEGDYCNSDCTQTTGSCGDGTKQDNEVCDDANEVDGDYCNADCSESTGSCGDNVKQDNEICDDGNQDDDDYCKSDCSLETGFCGDNVIQGNEVCDDGNQVEGDYCDGFCVNVIGSCGDGVTQANESCDDGQTTDCLTTHNGGDGACLPTNQCSPGYSLDANGVCMNTNTTGLSTPCSQGPGYAMFKIHYDSGSTSARVDVWDASCNYSFASNSACNVREVCRGFCDVPRTTGGNPIFNTSNYWRARFSAAGLNFSSATLWIRAAGTRGSTAYRAWSPIYGDVIGGIVSGFNYDWYSVDWSNHLSPFDDPNLTAIQIYGMNSTIAVQAVELCVQ